METTTPVAADARPASHRYRVIGLVAGLVALIAIAGYVYYDRLEAPPAERLTVTIGAGPSRFLYTLDAGANTLAQIVFPKTETEAFFPVSWVEVDDMDYYLLAESGKLGTNIFSRAKDGSLTAITSSDTVKLDLSYDPENQRFSYTLLEGATLEEVMDASAPTTVILLDAKTGSETNLGEGSRPSITADGSQVIYARENLLIAYDIASKTHTQLLASTMSPLYAVDAKTGILAVYDPRSARVDLYAMRDGALLAEGDSLPLSKAPEALAYVDGRLMAGNIEEQESGRAYLFSEVGGDRGTGVLLTEGLPYGTIITISADHD